MPCAQRKGRTRRGSWESSQSQPSLAQCPEKVIGAKYVRLLEKQLRTMREESAHGNRQLFLDDVFVVYLLVFFNPTVRSLRTVEDLSQTWQAQRHLSVERVGKSTLSDFNRITSIRSAWRRSLRRCAADSAIEQIHVRLAQPGGRGRGHAG